ncbi:MAG: hypothetical protein M1839_002396 [Geoglossum umbratile]|nr:MAG: hypothetical protein M1839_002396 [Geoglossum umbratile]
MTNQLSNVVTSMTSCRRSQPLPQDFAFALWKENLSLSSLRPHLQPLLPPSISQQSLPTPPPEDLPDRPLSPVLGPALCGVLDKQTPHIPAHFPSYPSKHTYKATPEFTKREGNPRKVRERATEEARLGEEALRKLLRAASGSGHRTDDSSALRSTKRKQRDRMWEKTVEALATGAGILGLTNGVSEIGASSASAANKNSAAAFPPEFGVIVNSEKGYWRKNAAAAHDRSRRRQTGTVVENGDVFMGGTGTI